MVLVSWLTANAIESRYVFRLSSIHRQSINLKVSRSFSANGRSCNICLRSTRAHETFIGVMICFIKRVTLIIQRVLLSLQVDGFWIRTISLVRRKGEQVLIFEFCETYLRCVSFVTAVVTYYPNQSGSLTQLVLFIQLSYRIVT